MILGYTNFQISKHKRWKVFDRSILINANDYENLNKILNFINS